LHKAIKDLTKTFNWAWGRGVDRTESSGCVHKAVKCSGFSELGFESGFELTYFAPQVRRPRKVAGGNRV